MKNTVLCYLEKDGCWLMLHRIKKKSDINAGKWIGIGGKFEENESPYDCLIRETFEETGYSIKSAELRGIVTFVSDLSETEQMFVYTSSNFEGESDLQTDEGILEWVPIDMVETLTLWEGDLIFIDYLKNKSPFFELKLVYQNDTLVSAYLKDERIK